MFQDIFKRKRESRGSNFGYCGRQGGVLGAIPGDWRNRLVLWGGESEEMRADPVEISHVDPFKLLVPRQS
jgi:hypothetical protein